MMEPVEFAARAVPPAPRRGPSPATPQPAQPGHLHLPRARPAGAAHPQAGSQVPRGRARRGPRRSWRTEDAEFVLVGYGIVARILKAVVELARARGMPSACFAPSRSIPSPPQQIRDLARHAKAFAVVETQHRPDGGRRAPRPRGPRPGRILQPRRRQRSLRRRGAGISSSRSSDAACAPQPEEVLIHG